MFKAFDKTFTMTGIARTIETRNYQFAHEAGAYDERTNSIYFTANWQTSRPVKIHRVDVETCEVEECHFDVVNANGACPYKDGILFCAQGSRNGGAGLIYVEPSTGRHEVIVDSFGERPFNSPNDVIVDDGIWFTDPKYGYDQGFRPKPVLPCLVYRLTDHLQVVEDSLMMPNGICKFKNTMYITDTGMVRADEPDTMTWHPEGPATIYAYDVVDGLRNKRIFARVDCGVPDGIKCDATGNVWTGCGDGIHVFNTRGKLIGKVLIPGGVANFCFTPGKIWVMNEYKLIVIDTKDDHARIENGN